MRHQNLDLTIAEVLSDPVIGAAMRADHVDPRGFETLLRSTARRLDESRHVARLCASIVSRSRCSSALTRPSW